MSKKLCKLVSDGFLDDHTKKYTHMVSDPNYVCMKCGRVANDEDSLCRPKKMKDKKEDERELKKEAKKETEKETKKEAKKESKKSEGYKQISEDLANEKMMKFDEKIKKRIVKVSKKELRNKKDNAHEVITEDEASVVEVIEANDAE